MAKAKEVKDTKYSDENNAKRGNRYTTEQKLQCLMVLQANKFSLNKTSKQTGVADVTLKAWLATFGEELFGNAKEAEIQAETQVMASLIPAYQEKMQKDKAAFLTLAYEVKLNTLRKIQSKLARTNRVWDLVNIVRVLDKATYEAEKGLTPNPPAAPNFGNQQVNLFTQIHNKYSLPIPDEDE